jgi:hypothetical protein
VYPVPRPDDDPRFTFGLTLDVADALARHGFPIGSGADFVALQQALFAFLYGPAEEPDVAAEDVASRPTCMGAPAGFEADCGRPGPHGPHS